MHNSLSHIESNFEGPEHSTQLRRTPSSETLRVWACKQLLMRVVCKIFNESGESVKVFGVASYVSYTILIWYALIKVKYNGPMTLYMGVGALAMTVGLKLLSRLFLPRSRHLGQGAHVSQKTSTSNQEILAAACASVPALDGDRGKLL